MVYNLWDLDDALFELLFLNFDFMLLRCSCKSIRRSSFASLPLLEDQYNTQVQFSLELRDREVLDEAVREEIEVVLLLQDQTHQLI